MAFNRAHASIKAADVAELLVLNKFQITHIHPCGVFCGSISAPI